jgi:hypothetical protein
LDEVVNPAELPPVDENRRGGSDPPEDTDEGYDTDEALSFPIFRPLFPTTGPPLADEASTVAEDESLASDSGNTLTSTPLTTSMTTTRRTRRGGKRRKYCRGIHANF